jgi:hypothetical protein
MEKPIHICHKLNFKESFKHVIFIGATMNGRYSQSMEALGKTG